MTGLVNVTKSYFSGGNVIDGDPSTERVKVPETKKRKVKDFSYKNTGADDGTWTRDLRLTNLK